MRLKQEDFKLLISLTHLDIHTGVSLNLSRCTAFILKANSQLRDLIPMQIFQVSSKQGSFCFQLSQVECDIFSYSLINAMFHK